MNPQYFQLWRTLPMVGRQFSAWVWATLPEAYALQASLAAGAAAGIQWEVLNQQGQPIAPGGGLTSPPTVPGLDDLLGTLGGYVGAAPPCKCGF